MLYARTGASAAVSSLYTQIQRQRYIQPPIDAAKPANMNALNSPIAAALIGSDGLQSSSRAYFAGISGIALMQIHTGRNAKSGSIAR